MAVNLMGDGGAWGSSNWWEEDNVSGNAVTTSNNDDKDNDKGGDLEAGTYGKTNTSSYDGQTNTLSSTKEDPFKDAFDADDDPEKYMGIYDKIKDNIDKIDSNEQEISQLRASYLESTQSKEKADIMDRFDKIMADNRVITKSLQSQLKESKIENDKYQEEHVGSSVAQWRVNQLNSCTRRFKTSTNLYQKELKEFQNVLKETQKRQIGVVAPDNMTEEDKNKLSENYEAADQFLKQQFNLTDVSDQMQDRLAELEARHNGMMQIEQGVKELQEMWNELHTLIMDQQELLDNIENNVMQTKDFVTKGAKHIEKAEVHQKQSRKLQLCLLCMLLVIAVILASVFGFGG